jgi:hypothetical protein
MVRGIQNIQTAIKFTHGPKLPKNHFQKVQNYTNSYKIRMRYEYIGSAHTCSIKKCTIVGVEIHTHCKVAREVVGGPRGPIVIIVEVIQCKVD